jgi:hypothetical protein
MHEGVKVHGGRLMHTNSGGVKCVGWLLFMEDGLGISELFEPKDV